jgi:hypothetical protein
MAGLILELDAASSNPDGTSPGTALLLTDAANGWQVLAFDPGTAEPEYQYASSVDTDGSVPVSGKHQNRTVTVTLHVARTTPALLRTALDTLGQKIGKVFREGGTLKLTLPDASVRIFDLVGGDHGLAFNKRFVNNVLAEVTLRLPARPYWRGAESDLGDNTETTLPCLIFTEASIPGDVPALGRLVIDEDQAVDQRWVKWAVQSRYYSSSANAALFYEAEGRTAMGGSAIAVGPAGASGAGSNVMRNTALTTSYQAVLSTQATGGGAHLSHIGTFQVYARVQIPTSNTGTVSVALEWGEGDFRRFTQNTGTVLAPTWEGTWQIIDLGFVAPQKAVTGTQRWEGRVIAKSTVAGDDLDIDWLEFFPVDEGSGEVRAVQRLPAPTAYSARDEFDQSAGALTAKTLPVGGTWAGAGDADDFSVTGSGTVTRTAVSDANVNTGRYATASTPTLANTLAQMNCLSFSGSGTDTSYGVIARYVDTNNWLMLRVEVVSFVPSVRVLKRVAGTVTELASRALTTTEGTELPALRLLVDQTGYFAAWVVSDNETIGVPDLSGQDAVLATGGTLATGKVGIYDANTGAGANTRTYDDFWAFTFLSDAAVFASQSLEIRHDCVIREDSTGAFWQRPSWYEGDYLLVPASGAEARTARVIVMGSRSVPGDGADSGIDDRSARLFVTPRYL